MAALLSCPTAEQEGREGRKEGREHGCRSDTASTATYLLWCGGKSPRPVGHPAATRPPESIAGERGPEWTREMPCAASKGLTLLRSSPRTTQSALHKALNLYRSLPPPWDAEGMGSSPAVAVLGCTNPEPAPTTGKGKASPELCRYDFRQVHAPRASRHPPLQLLQRHRHPQAVSQEEEGSQDVRPLHHLAQRAPLQHPRAENVPRLLRQEADVNQDLGMGGEGSVPNGWVGRGE